MPKLRRFRVPSLEGLRAGLDERAWSELRRSCPARQTSPAVDLKMAERVLANPSLYAAALHPPRGATALARNAAPLTPPSRSCAAGIPE